MCGDVDGTLSLKVKCVLGLGRGLVYAELSVTCGRR